MTKGHIHICHFNCRKSAFDTQTLVVAFLALRPVALTLLVHLLLCVVIW